MDDPQANPPTVTNQRSYLGPWAHLDPGFDPVYYHHNHLGTTRLLSEADGQGGHDLFPHVYSAFGQPITGPDPPMTRYGYVGAYGYEGGLLTFEGAQGTIPMTLSHVGERWYDPSIGRFIQRDPIGISAGVNVYRYVRSNPISTVDPKGLYPFGAMQEHVYCKCLREKGLSSDEIADLYKPGLPSLPPGDEAAVIDVCFGTYALCVGGIVGWAIGAGIVAAHVIDLYIEYGP